MPPPTSVIANNAMKKPDCHGLLLAHFLCLSHRTLMMAGDDDTAHLPLSLFQKWRMFFPITFIMSILWIAVFSFLMVWWTETFGRTIGLGDRPEVSGARLERAGSFSCRRVEVVRRWYNREMVSPNHGHLRCSCLCTCTIYQELLDVLAKYGHFYLVKLHQRNMR